MDVRVLVCLTDWAPKCVLALCCPYARRACVYGAGWWSTEEEDSDHHYPGWNCLIKLHVLDPGAPRAPPVSTSLEASVEIPAATAVEFPTGQYVTDAFQLPTHIRYQMKMNLPSLSVLLIGKHNGAPYVVLIHDSDKGDRRWYTTLLTTYPGLRTAHACLECHRRGFGATATGQWEVDDDALLNSSQCDERACTTLPSWRSRRLEFCAT